MIDFNHQRLKRYLIFAMLLLMTSMTGQESTHNGRADKTIYTIPGVSRSQLESVLDGESSVEKILPLIEKLSIQNPDQCVLVVNELLMSERVKKFSDGWAKLLYYKTKIDLDRYLGNEELELLQENIEQCIAYFQRRKMTLWRARCLNLLSDICFHISFNNDDSLFVDASESNDKALSMMRRNQNDIEQSYSILGEIYRVRGNICSQKKECTVDSTLSYYDVALDYFAINEDKSGQSKTLVNKAIVLKKLENDEVGTDQEESPIKYFEQAISVSGLSNDQYHARLEYAIYLQSQFHSDLEKSWNQKSNEQLRKILQITNDRKSAAYFQLAVNQQNLLSYTADELTDEQYDRLLDTVVLYYQKTFEACKRENNIKVYNELFDRLAMACPYFPENKCSELLITANEVKGHFLQKNKSINEEITRRNEAFRIAIESQKRKVMWMIFAVFFLIASLIFFYYFNKQKMRNLRSTLSIKQEALRAQMNPHFISNTINAIESLVNQGRNDEASEYLIDFSRLCRLVINHSRDSSISLQEEIETLKYFLSLEKLRLADDLDFTISVDNRLNSEWLMVPPLILQPFIENAIWHGIKNKPEPKHGELKVKINKISEDTIECIIEDNGVGRAKAGALQKASIVDQKSWGTTLTQERIKFLEKAKYASLETIDLFDEEGHARGTRIRIVLPVQIRKMK